MAILGVQAIESSSNRMDDLEETCLADYEECLTSARDITLASTTKDPKAAEYWTTSTLDELAAGLTDFGRGRSPEAWLITGSSRGFGRSLAEAVLSAGDSLVATTCNRVVDLADPHGSRVPPFTLEVAEPEQGPRGRRRGCRSDLRFATRPLDQWTRASRSATRTDRKDPRTATSPMSRSRSASATRCPAPGGAIAGSDEQCSLTLCCPRCSAGRSVAGSINLDSGSVGLAASPVALVISVI